MLKDTVAEKANGPGTAVAVQLLGPTDEGRAFIGTQTFSDGDQCYYVIKSGALREWGIGTLAAGTPNTLSRTTVLGNSARTLARLNFTGSCVVYNDLPSSRMPYLGSGGLLLPQFLGDLRYSQLQSNVQASIPNNTGSGMSWNVKAGDTLGAVPAGGGPFFGFTAPENGLYIAVLNLEWVANTTGQRVGRITVAGGAVAIDRKMANTGLVNNSVTWIGGLAAGQVVSSNITQDSGAALNAGGNAQSNFTLVRLQ